MRQPEGLSVPERRTFFRRLAAAMIGGVAALAPVVSGLLVFLDPLRRKSAAAGEVLVTTLKALPPDGVPRKFNIISDRKDAWNTHRNMPVGAVYLRRTSETEVAALNVVCPHAGCFVTFAAEHGRFLCPCHNSTFALDGAIEDPSSPSPRAMDSLTVEIRNEDEVWVRFQNFLPGHKEKIPVA